MSETVDRTSVQYETACNALALLTATHLDEHDFGQATKGFMYSVLTENAESIADTQTKAILLALGMTALARVLIETREYETGESWQDTLTELGRRTGTYFSVGERFHADKLRV